MITLQKIEQMVSRVMKSAISRERDGEIKPYKGPGGQSGHGWETVGFYAADAESSRLVFEVLFYPTSKICVIRVNRENAPEILFARKWSGRKSRFEAAMNEAASAFRVALPALPIIVQDESDLNDIPMSAEERELLASVLKPFHRPN